MNCFLSTFVKSPLFTSSRCVSLCSRLYRGSKLDFEDSEDVQKTTVSFLSRGTEGFQVTGCIYNGFKFGGNVVMGSIALLPNTVLKWKPEKVEDITESSLGLFSVLYPKLEIVIIGTGNIIQRVEPEVTAAMRKRGLILEVQDTKNACGVYNLLKNERPGQVGAALLPLWDDGKLILRSKQKKRSKSSIVQ